MQLILSREALEPTRVRWTVKCARHEKNVSVVRTVRCSVFKNIDQFMMFNKRRRWFHTSRVKLPLVNMSASWFFGVNNFDLDLKSKLLLSSHLSNATL